MNIFSLFRDSKRIDHQSAPGLMASIEELALKAGTSTPKVRLVTTAIPNAAYHPPSDTLFITNGILDMMGSSNLRDPASREMKAVLAHEMGHVRFKYGQFLPIIGITAAGAVTALAAAYLLEKTYDNVKNAKQDPKNPVHFWDEFGHVAKDTIDGGWKSFKDFAGYIYPSYGKILKADRYKDDSWSKVLFHEAKIAAISALSVIPSFAACRPIALRNEWQSDKFMLALTEDKEACLSAFKKLAGHSEHILTKRAATPVQKSFAKKISHAIQNFMANTVMAHPELAERIKFIEHANVGELAKSFRL